jgi:hypothetical protein
MLFFSNSDQTDKSDNSDTEANLSCSRSASSELIKTRPMPEGKPMENDNTPLSRKKKNMPQCVLF